MMAMLRFGDIVLDNPVILAPMAGVSDAPFRRLARRFGVGLAVSEMIASKAMVRAHTKTLRMSSALEDEGPLSVQIAGCEPETMADAARMNRDRGAAIIDINMGCPAKKIVNGEAGAALMKDEILAGRIIEQVVRAVDAPVTVKMRLGWDEGSINAPRLARIAQESGAVLVTVHGRTRSQFYGGQANWRAIGEVKRAVAIPIVGNGDVTTLDDAKDMLEQSGADGVMIGRGSYGRPWFPGQVARFLATGERLPDPSLAERYAILREHYEAMLDHYGPDAGLRMGRKHIAWYTRGIPGSAEFRDRVMRLGCAQGVKDALDAFFTPRLDGARQAA
jgi:tRNA-dihydrouridine synthase B